MHKRGWCRLKLRHQTTLKLRHGVRKLTRVRLHCSQRLWEVSESWHLPNGEKSTFSSADNLRFDARTNMGMIDDILVRRMYDFDVKNVSWS